MMFMILMTFPTAEVKYPAERAARWRARDLDLLPLSEEDG